MTMDRKQHWETVHTTKGEQNASWFEAQPVLSLRMIEAAEWSLKPMDIWHDRAVFHFLIAADDRSRYRDHLRRTLKTGGTAILATFALEGPETCSGLPVARYSPQTLAAEIGSEFHLVEAVPYEHRTPWGAVQPFVYARFRREAATAESVSHRSL